jgi:hypothetical protein
VVAGPNLDALNYEYRNAGYYDIDKQHFNSKVSMITIVECI